VREGSVCPSATGDREAFFFPRGDAAEEALDLPVALRLEEVSTPT
jgi:hypothetical protein